jgi:hypothetical protein
VVVADSQCWALVANIQDHMVDMVVGLDLVGIAGEMTGHNWG